MTKVMVRRQEQVTAQVLTPELFEAVRGLDPGAVKRASVGDYWVKAEDGSCEILTPSQLAIRYIPIDGGHELAYERLAEALHAVRGQLETLQARLDAHERTAAVEQPAKAAQKGKG